MTYDKEKPEPNQIHDLDELLRKSAPGTSTPQEFRRTLKLVLLSNFGPNRSKWLSFNRLGVIAIAILFLFLMNGNDVGSGDFRLKPRGKMYESIHGTIIYGGDEKTQEIYEQIYQREFAKEETLRSICGWTVLGITYLSAEYAYDIDGESHTVSRTIKTPISSLPTKQHYEFLQAFEEEFFEKHKNGQTVPVGREDIQLDRLLIPLHKWKAIFPDYGEIIYWEGHP